MKFHPGKSIQELMMHSYSAFVIKTPTTPRNPARTRLRSRYAIPINNPKNISITSTCSNKTMTTPKPSMVRNELNRFRPACAIIAAPNPSQGITQRQPDVIVANKPNPKPVNAVNVACPMPSMMVRIKNTPMNPAPPASSAAPTM